MTAPISSPRLMKRSSATASRTTGTIMTMISTDIDHHCGPRVAFWAAIRIGQGLGVGAGEEEGQQILVPGHDQDQDEGGGEAGVESGSTIDQKIR